MSKTGLEGVMLDPTKTIHEWEAETSCLHARIAALEAENARLIQFKNQAANILLSLTTGIIRVMEEQLEQSRKVASQMQAEIEEFTQEPPHESN